MEQPTDGLLVATFIRARALHFLVVPFVMHAFVIRIISHVLSFIFLFVVCVF